MAETMQSLEGLAALKPAAPEAPKYLQKLESRAARTPPASARTRLRGCGSSPAAAAS